jgi:hypothetical protein
MSGFSKALAVLVLIGLSTAAYPVRADLPSIRFDRMTPLGAAAGSSVEVEVLGGEIEDLKGLLFDHPGLSAELIKDRKFKVTVAADVPSGTYDVFLVGRFGVSNPRLFSVSRGLVEVAEKEPNNEATQAQPIEVNSVINASSDGNGEDDFRFSARKGQRITLHVQAQRLDSPMDATLTLTTATGGPIASSSDWFGSDPFLDFLAPADGDYIASVSDLSFRGGFPYRLVLTDHPQLENVWPRAMQAGKPVELTFFGRNLGPASRPSPLKLFDLPLDELKSTLTAPPEILTLGTYRFSEHPTDHTVLPTAATCTLFGWQTRPEGMPEALNPVPVVVTDKSVTLEAEPNDSNETPQKLTLPAVVSGRFNVPRDADWFEFETTENGPHSIEVYSERIAGQADPYITVLDEKGNRVGDLDDFGHRMNAFDGHLRDPSGSVNLQEKKRYRLLVQDRYQRGGPRFQYVLTVSRPEPDFFPAVIHSQNPGPGGLNVFRGSAASLDIVIHQRDGFNGPITITAENLPAGLHAAPTVVANNTRGNFVVWADESAEPTTAFIKLVATGKRGETELRREARAYARVTTDPGYNSSRPLRALPVAIRETAPFSIGFTTERVEVESGQKVDLTLQMKRLWPEYKEKLLMQAMALPGGLNLPNGEIPAGQSEGKLTLSTQAGMAAGEYTISVLGQGQVPFNKDPKATSRPNTLVAIPSRPLTVVVKAAPKK